MVIKKLMTTFVAVFVGRTHEQMLNSLTNCNLRKENKGKIVYTIGVYAICVGFNIRCIRLLQTCQGVWLRSALFFYIYNKVSTDFANWMKKITIIISLTF